METWRNMGKEEPIIQDTRVRYFCTSCWSCPAMMLTPHEFIKIGTHHVVMATFHMLDYRYYSVPIGLNVLSMDTSWSSMEWFTVWCFATEGKCWTQLYAAHMSVHTITPGWMCCWIMGRTVAASRWATSYQVLDTCSCPPYQTPTFHNVDDLGWF